jgi:hypothetical protein
VIFVGTVGALGQAGINEMLGISVTRSEAVTAARPEYKPLRPGARGL